MDGIAAKRLLKFGLGMVITQKKVGHSKECPTRRAKEWASVVGVL
jgi:hypothetical protein